MRKLLVIGLLKFGTLATPRGRLPTMDDVRKEKKKKKEKRKKKEEQERLCNKNL